MKTKLTSIIALLALAMTLTAQKGNISSADYEITLDNADLEKAEAKVLEAETHEKTMNWSKTYLVKQRVMRAKFNKDNSDTESLFIGAEALKKAQELDMKGDAKGKGIGKSRGEIKKDIIMLRLALQNAAGMTYNAKDFATATKLFEAMLDLDQMSYSVEEGEALVLDTAILYNTALSAYNGEDKEKTAKYMTQCMEVGFGGSTPHTVMYIEYQEQEDTAKMVETLIDGFEKHSDDAIFLSELVKYYVGINDLEQGMKYINVALDKDPTNSTFWFTKGSFHDQAKEKDLAVEAYTKAIETADSEMEIYYPNFNLYIMTYNAAVEANNAVNDEKDFKIAKEKAAAAKLMFKDCIPYLDACLEAKPNDIDALRNLKTVYYRFSDDPEMLKKYEETDALIKSLE